MKNSTLLIFAVLTLVGFALLAFHIVSETSTTKDYLTSILIIVANIGMYFAVKKSEKWKNKK